MSWPGEEWKVGLPARALRAIAEVEQRLERLQKERQQKQVQLDTLEAVMHKQKQKHEEERTSWALLSQENRSLAESCQQTERARQRLAQELQAKEAQLSCLEAQLAQATRRQAELEEELRRCQTELDSLQSRSHLVLLPPRWGSPMLWPEGSIEAQAETSQSLAPGPSPVQRSCPPLGGARRRDHPIICWQQEATCPSAPPGSPVPTENGESVRPVASELTSTSEKLKEENQELRLALAKAETLRQEKEKEVRHLRGELELTRAELAQCKKHRGDQVEAGPRERRRLSEDVSRSRNLQKGQLGLERLPLSGSHRSISSSRQEQVGEKKGATTKGKGSKLPSLRTQSTDRSRNELQTLKAEVLVLQQRLEASESQRKSLLESCLQRQKQESQVWAQERQFLPSETSLQQEKQEFSKSQGDGEAGDKTQAVGKGEDSGKVETDREEAVKELESQAEEMGELEVWQTQVGTNVVGVDQAHGEMPLLAAEGGLLKCSELNQTTGPEGDLEALQGELQALASRKAEAEAQAGLAQRKLQNLQAVLGNQTERLAQAMETQKRHVEELLADAEEKDQLLKSLRQELEETQKELAAASTERQRLEALLGCGDGVPCGNRPVELAEPSKGSQTVEEKLPTWVLGDEMSTGADSLPGHPQEEQQRHLEVQKQLEISVARLTQENQALREELAQWDTQRCREEDDETVIGPSEVVCLGDGREAGSAEVPEAAQKREPLLQGSHQNAQTQTDPEGTHRRRERISVAFDDTQYEPYGLPEVVMKASLPPQDLPTYPLALPAPMFSDGAFWAVPLLRSWRRERNQKRIHRKRRRGRVSEQSPPALVDFVAVSTVNCG